jgi:hypothetical protein
MAFPKSFSNSFNAKQAIAKQGWNPLNYYLLTVLPTKDDVVDLTEAQDRENYPPPAPKLNLNNGVGSYHLNLLIEEQKENEGRKKWNEEMKSKQKTKQQKADSLKKLTKVSSAQLAANNHYPW